MIERGITPADADAARERLKTVLLRHGSMVVAFSGGVDSALLAFAAHEVLGDRMLAVIAASPSLPGAEEEDALAFLRAHRIPFERIVTDELASESYAANNPDRCYHCKKELFGRLGAIAASRAYAAVAYGANADDAGDYRPGASAAADYSVVAPLAESGIGKDLVREIARSLGLRVWDKPSSPCLASRIPYYQTVTREKLERIEKAERVLKDHGFRICRVRHDGDAARIEIPLEDHARIAETALWAGLVAAIEAAGFRSVTLDPEGFRSGRLNDALKERTKDGEKR
jgi:uncharacterized protein